jgi:tripartite-type tricarboxylate transporter receptor subunit TctC
MNKLLVCSINYDAASLMTNIHTVGHTTPVGPFSRAVTAINDSFGARLKPIAYDGSGATKTGLYNGEVDYALISIKHGRDIIKNGGQCFYEYSANQNSDLIPLAVLDPSNKLLIAGYDAVWLALNMNAEEVATLKAQIKEIHNDPSSAMYEYTQGGKVLNVIWDLSDNDIIEKWEISVKNLQE